VNTKIRKIFSDLKTFVTFFLKLFAQQEVKKVL